MQSIQFEFLSECMNMRTNFNMFLPEFFEIKDNIPVLYLLHGLTGNCDDWKTMANAKGICSQYNIAVIMPSAANSFYTNMLYGPKYFEYIANELPSYIKKLFPLLQDKWHIAGLSMGGYGAFKIAMHYPERFISAGSFSGCLDLQAMIDRKKHPEINQALKACIGESLQTPKKDDLFYLAKSMQISQNPNLAMYMYCGEQDFLYDDNEKFYQINNSILNLEKHTEPGGHEWRLWEKHLKMYLQKVFGNNGNF